MDTSFLASKAFWDGVIPVAFIIAGAYFLTKTMKALLDSE